YLVSGPPIVSKYVGDSEETLRMLFAAAQADTRAIIFFDGIDSIASSRETDTNGVGKRLVAQLLTLMDGFESKGNVVVVAATNRLEHVDPALLRPARFDWQLPFPMPSERDRLGLLQVQAHSSSIAGGLPLDGSDARSEGWARTDVVS
ncbi:UNVERIFIED_CONTAM: AAA family ATPase, partial [Bifidobacterium breve]